MKRLQYVLLSLVTVFTLSSTASAHVVVKPGDVTTGSFQTFTMGVPNEKGGAVVAVKLLIPDNVSSVTPTVKQGWTITTEKSGEGESAVVKSITWSGGTIGESLRDEFTFSAKTPDQAVDLQWKAYETYDSGLTVAWDKTASEQPKKADGSPDFSKSGPFSITKVAEKATNDDNASDASVTNKDDTVARALGGAALLIGLSSIAITARKK